MEVDIITNATSALRKRPYYTPYLNLWLKLELDQVVVLMPTRVMLGYLTMCMIESLITHIVTKLL